jgi:hypothetical protein
LIAICGNQVTESDFAGVHLENPRDVVIFDNTITDNGKVLDPHYPYGIALIAKPPMEPRSIVIHGNRIGNSTSNTSFASFKQVAGVYGEGRPDAARPGIGMTPFRPTDIVVAGNDVRRNLLLTTEQPINGDFDNLSIGSTSFDAGSTANRPTWAKPGQLYFDTSILKPVWYNGTAWVTWNGS